MVSAERKWLKQEGLISYSSEGHSSCENIITSDEGNCTVSVSGW